MSHPNLALLADEDPQDEFSKHTAVQAMDEVCEALIDLERPSSHYFRFPWKALNGLVGGVPKGDVWYIGAFSGHGKTTFLTSLLDACYERGDKIYYLGLESKPKSLRTHWACKRIGYEAGKILSGDYLQDWGEPAIKAARAAISAELKLQIISPYVDRVKFCPVSLIDYNRLWRSAEDAMSFGADIFIVDHVDHIQSHTDGGSLYNESVKINQALLQIAQQTGMRVLPATQFNNEIAKANKLAVFLPPQPHYVKMGGHKREIATGMLALYRPLKIAGVDQGKLKAFHANTGDWSEILEPNTMAVYCMKHRHYGAREGTKIYLGVEHGKVLDTNQDLFKSTKVV